MFASVLILFGMKMLINDIFSAADANTAEMSFNVMSFSFAKLYFVAPVWILMFLTHCLLLPIMWTWRIGSINDRVYTAFYVLHQIAFVLGYAKVVIWLDLPIASSLILLCEQTRMFMKAHSFWRETLRIKHAPMETPRGINTHLSNSESNTHLLPTFTEQMNQFLLFHFVSRHASALLCLQPYGLRHFSFADLRCFVFCRCRR